MGNYQHISFRKAWELDEEILYMLGQCDAFVQSISDLPLTPESRQKLLKVALIKGAQATTAIEGNTLSQEEILKIDEGWRLPPSKEYLEIEVKNILDAFNFLMNDVTSNGAEQLITADLVRDFHQMIAKNLGAHIDAIPGRFREDNRVVGPYRAPDYTKVPELMQNFCHWLKKEFHYEKGQSFATAVIQAIVAHVYIEWIHPFGDGNGRTGRLLEFYILLRAGLPNIVSHILSNYYNQTRSEYYRQLNQARLDNSLTNFIKYAVLGFRDGLQENLSIIQENQFKIFWRYYIYQTFGDLKHTKETSHKRKRELILNFSLSEEFEINELLHKNPTIAALYAATTKATINRDFNELVEMDLLVKSGKKYKANTQLLKTLMPAKKTKK